jgi:mannose-6-phosphate isomerase
MNRVERIFILKNPLQKYAWGSETFIPDLLGIPSYKEEPVAEMWMGAHPSASSHIIWNGRWVSLLDLVTEMGVEVLGRAAAVRFQGAFPFLFKILAATRPLSIQVHPDRISARAGFLRENRDNIPLTSPYRNYKDLNHKPELICALTPFWAMKGFRRIDRILDLASGIGSPHLDKLFDGLRLNPGAEGLRRFFASLMRVEEVFIRPLMAEVGAYCERARMNDPAFRWVETLIREHPGDIGALSPLFLNLVCLAPGEGLFIDPGEIHSYLEGSGIELMANSDNVLRCGLTPKHLDVPELVKIARFEPADPQVLRPVRLRANEMVYPTAVEEFMLSVISLDEGTYIGGAERSVELLICTEGTAVIRIDAGDALPLTRGGSLLIPAAVKGYRIEGTGTLFKAAVPAGGFPHPI